MLDELDIVENNLIPAYKQRILHAYRRREIGFMISIGLDLTTLESIRLKQIIQRWKCKKKMRQY